MSSVTHHQRDAAIIHLPSIDSTNNYAMRLIDADESAAGISIVADVQTEGRGQRGNGWTGMAGDSLLMSAIVKPGADLACQFSFSAAVAVTVAEILMELYEHWNVSIKWPNDIIINDRKAGGILIENIVRGAQWTHSIAGLGINVRQAVLPGLPYATSLWMASRKDFGIMDLARTVSAALSGLDWNQVSNGDFLRAYNSYLYRRGSFQAFSNGREEWKVVILGVGSNGLLEVELADGAIARYAHGSVTWVWQ